MSSIIYARRLSVLPDGRMRGHFAVFWPRNFSNVREKKIVRGLAEFEKSNKFNKFWINYA